MYNFHNINYIILSYALLSSLRTQEDEDIILRGLNTTPKLVIEWTYAHIEEFYPI